MNENNIVKRLLKEFDSPTELNKKQISVFLKPETINQLDKILVEFNKYTVKNTSRNYLIELAIEELIKGFPKALEAYKKKNNPVEKEFDTVVYPSDYTGLNTLQREKKWYYVRINENYISKIKYIAIYLGYPESRITYYAKVKNYEPKIVDGKKKYVVHIEGNIIPLRNYVVLGNSSPLSVRSPKYTTLEKLKKAKEVADLN